MLSKSFRAVVTATASAGVGLTAFGDRPLLVTTVAGMGGIFALGWPGLLGLPARQGTSVLLLATVAAGVSLQWLTGDLAYAALGFGIVVVAAFVLQLLRRDGRPRLVESVAGAVTGAAVVISGVGWLAVGTGPTSVGLLLVGAVTLAAAAIVTAMPLPTNWGWLVTTAVAASVGLGVGTVIVAVGPVTGVLVGLVAGILSATVHHLLGQFPASVRAWPALSAAVLPVLVCGAPVYVLGRILLLL